MENGKNMEPFENIIKKPLWKIRLESIQDKMGAAERRVAAYLLQDPQAIVALTITEVAEGSSTSEATVVRFSRHLGFEGFQDLKLSIAQDVVPTINVMYDGIEKDDPISVIKEKIFYGSMQAMHDTVDLLDNNELEKAVDAIVNAKNFDICGMGGSGVLAADAQHKFIKLGIRANSFSDAHLQALSVSHLGKGDVALAISYSGTTRDIIETMETARKNGATTIGITHLAKSPLTRVSDIKLFTTASEAMFRSDGIVSRMAQLAIVDTLYVGVGLRLGDKALINLEKGRQASVSKGY